METVNKLEADLEQALSYIDDLESAIESMRSSRSWRLTAALRNKRGLQNALRGCLRTRSYVLQAQRRSCVTTVASYELNGDALPVGRGYWDFSEVQSPLNRARLYIDDGEGFSEHAVLELDSKEKQGEACLPQFVRGLRFDCNIEGDGSLAPEHFQIRVTPISSIAVYISGLWRAVFNEGRFGSCFLPLLRGNFLQARAALLGYDFPPLLRPALYQSWIQDSEQAMIQKRLLKTPMADVLFSIVLPVYNTSPRFLRIALDSLLQQSYQKFEICIADDASTRQASRAVLEEYRDRDSRIKVCFRSENGHISACSNSALELATGDFIVLFDHDDVLPNNALAILASYIAEHPDTKCFYSDEDRIDSSGRRRDPFFKPAFDVPQMLSQNMISHLGCFHRSVISKINGFRIGYEGSQDWDLALRTLAAVGPEAIKHIPFVLYHWRDVPRTFSATTNTQSSAKTSAALAVTDFLEQQAKQRDEYIVRQGRSGLLLQTKRKDDISLLAADSTPQASFGELIPKGVVLQAYDSTSADFNITLNDTLTRIDSQFVLFFAPGFKPVHMIDCKEIQFYLEQDLTKIVSGRHIALNGKIIADGYEEKDGDLRPIHAGARERDLESTAGYCHVGAVAAFSASCFACRKDALIAVLNRQQSRLGTIVVEPALCLRRFVFSSESLET